MHGMGGGGTGMAKVGMCGEVGCVWQWGCMHGKGGMHGEGGMHGRGWGGAWQGACMGGGMHGRGVCVAGGHAWQGGGVHGRRGGHCSRQYASYWNVFLLIDGFRAFQIITCCLEFSFNNFDTVF